LSIRLRAGMRSAFVNRTFLIKKRSNFLTILQTTGRQMPAKRLKRLIPLPSFLLRLKLRTKRQSRSEAKDAKRRRT